MTAFVLFAALSVLPPPTDCELPNTESATNVALSVQTDRLGTVQFTLALEASPSNNVEFAVGADADLDGDLSLEEADFTLGYDCGVWFFAETATGEVTEEPSSVTGRVERVLQLRRRQFSPNWNLVKFIRRGTAPSAESLTASITYPGTTLILR